MAKISRVLSEGEFNELSQRIRSGENAGGVLWIGLPAQTAQGRTREETCRHSEVANYGPGWMDLSRCPKQIMYSCDGCMKYTTAPFHEKV